MIFQPAGKAGLGVEASFIIPLSPTTISIPKAISRARPRKDPTDESNRTVEEPLVGIGGGFFPKLRSTVIITTTAAAHQLTAARATAPRWLLGPRCNVSSAS